MADTGRHRDPLPNRFPDGERSEQGNSPHRVVLWGTSEHIGDTPVAVDERGHLITVDAALLTQILEELREIRLALDLASS